MFIAMGPWKKDHKSWIRNAKILNNKISLEFQKFNFNKSLTVKIF